MNTTSATLRADADSLRRNADTLDEMARERQLLDGSMLSAQADAKRAEANELDDRARQSDEFLATLYADRVLDMRAEDLLDDLESSVRQNRYGSHDDQIRIVRAELLRRLV